MASAVEICNMALAYLGDRANVASIDPPEGSTEAEHCARFYPIARDTLLEAHCWNFATRRAQLAQLSITPIGWDYAYARPSSALRVFSIFSANMQREYGLDNGVPFDPPQQDFICESDDNGTPIIFTNQASAYAKYTIRVTDTARFSPLFVNTLAWHLASMLAGPIYKGDVGMKQAQYCAQMMNAFLAQAKNADANQRKIPNTSQAPWINARG
jgi:hypothetical protein